MKNFVIISGCSGGGKSTLLAALAAYGFPVIEEPGRRIVREELANDGEALPWRNSTAFIERVLTLAEADYEMARARRADWIFFDRGLVDASVALQHLTGKGLSLDRRYHDTVFLVPPWKEIYVADDARRHDFGEAIAEYERLLQDYPLLGYEVVILPKVGVDERVSFILKALVR